MENYSLALQIRWSDLDPNFHLRHSVYYDWGAYCRTCFLYEHGLTGEVMLENKVGPILFREECKFRREIKFGDPVTIEMELTWARTDFSRWCISHRIFKNSEILAANLVVEGAWIDTVQRKLTSPPEIAAKVFDAIPKPSDFQWINK